MQLDSHTFKGAGNFHGARMWYDELTDDIKDRIQDTGFELSLEETIDQGACPWGEAEHDHIRRGTVPVKF